MKRLIEYTKVTGDIDGSGRLCLQTISTQTFKLEDLSVYSQVCMV